MRYFFAIFFLPIIGCVKPTGYSVPPMSEPDLEYATTIVRQFLRLYFEVDKDLAWSPEKENFGFDYEKHKEAENLRVAIHYNNSSAVLTFSDGELHQHINSKEFVPGGYSVSVGIWRSKGAVTSILMNGGYNFDMNIEKNSLTSELFCH